MKRKEIMILLTQTLVLCCCVFLYVIPVSCKLTEEGIRITAGDYAAPVIENLEVLDGRTLKMDFSERVKVKSVVVSKMVKNLSDSMEHSDTIEASPALLAAGGKNGSIETQTEVSEDGLTVTYTLEEECEIGENYELFGVAEDVTGNSLTFCIPFVGFNSRIPELIMTEVQIKFTGKSGKKEVNRGEYVEFLVLKGGSLGGLELAGAMDGESKKYCFPPVDVEAGSVFLVHLRTAGQGCVDERENLSEASAAHSADGILDLWSENTEARFNDSADVILLRNSAGDILDVFMYADEKTLEWKKDAVTFAGQAVAAGIYDGEEISEAVLNKSTTSLKSFHRLDAKAIQDAVKNGEAYTYPVKNNKSLWKVETVSPGLLSSGTL